MIRDDEPGGEMDSAAMWAGEGDPPVDSATLSDIEVSLKVLDEVWPRKSAGNPESPRRFGKFTILRELGRGGFGVVFLARADPPLDRLVALKLPRIDVFSGAESWKRFLREARAAGRLDHPNLTPLLEADAVGPVGYITSAYVPGPNLEQWLRHNPTGGEPRWAARLIATLARGIEHAHERGILHCDLKPANVLLQAPECESESWNLGTWDHPLLASWKPRICDFGLARLREIEANETGSRIVLGTPAYMAPEQAESRRADIGPATDVYGLGTILYELLTGRKPFRGENNLEILKQVVVLEPAQLRAIRPSIPRNLEVICLKCLAKRPEARYPSAAALADDLERYLDGRAIAARREAFWSRCWRWTRRNPIAAALALTIGIASVAGLAGLIWHNSKIRAANSLLLESDRQLRLSNEKLRREKDRAEASEREANRNRILISRQDTGHRIYSAQQSLVANDLEMAHRLLDHSSNSIDIAANRRFAENYILGIIHDRLEILSGHDTPIHSMAFSNDCRLLATKDENYNLRVWELSNRTKLLWSAASQASGSVSFTPDGSILIVSHPAIQQFELRDSRSGVRLETPRGVSPKALLASLVFDAQQQCVAVGNDPAFTPHVLTRKDHHATPGARAQASIAEMHFTPFDQKKVVALADQLEEKPANRSGDHGTTADARDDATWPRGYAFSTDRDMIVAAPGDGGFTLVQRGSRVTLAFGSWTKSGIIVALPRIDQFSLERRRRVERWAHRIASSTACENGRFYRSVRLEQNVDRVAFDPSHDRFAYWSEERNHLTIHDARTGREITRYANGDLNDVETIRFSTDGQILALGCGDHRVRLWHPEPPSRSRILGRHRVDGVKGEIHKEAWCVAISPDNRIVASGGDDGQVRRWQIETGAELRPLRGHYSLVTSVAFSPDNETLASASFSLEQPIILWDLSKGRKKRTLTGHANFVRALAFGPSPNLLVSTGRDYTTMIWDAADGTRKNVIPHRPRGGSSIAISPDGHTIATTAGKSSILLIEASTGSIQTIATENEAVSLVFSRDGSRLISGDTAGAIKIWNVAACSELPSALSGHSGPVFGITLASDGETLASAGEDRTVRIWDIVTGQQLFNFTDCQAQVNAVVFSPDCNTLAAADHSGAIRIWQVKPSY
jgi:WD40 repeat protein